MSNAPLSGANKQTLPPAASVKILSHKGGNNIEGMHRPPPRERVPPHRYGAVAMLPMVSPTLLSATPTATHKLLA